MKIARLFLGTALVACTTTETSDESPLATDAAELTLVDGPIVPRAGRYEGTFVYEDKGPVACRLSNLVAPPIRIQQSTAASYKATNLDPATGAAIDATQACSLTDFQGRCGTGAPKVVDFHAFGIDATVTIERLGIFSQTHVWRGRRGFDETASVKFSCVGTQCAVAAGSFLASGSFPCTSTTIARYRYVN